jgi:precorrin-2 dehydrogenase / sirohydrochlorin ferrochelatase
MPVDEPLYPVGLRLAGQPCLVVGGGLVAVSKVEGLLEALAVVTVVAPSVDPALEALAGADRDTNRDTSVSLRRRAYQPSDLDGQRLVIAATDDPDVNHGVAGDAEARGMLVNVADDPAWCRFVLPSRVRRGPLLVTFSTGGASPALARWLRRRFTDEFGPEYETLIDLLSEARSELRRQGKPTEGLGWQEALDSGMLELIREGNLAEARERLQACLSSSSG